MYIRYYLGNPIEHNLYIYMFGKFSVDKKISGVRPFCTRHVKNQNEETNVGMSDCIWKLVPEKYY